MTAGEQNSAIYDALMAVKPAELSRNAWTARAGLGRSVFTEIRRHGNPTAETLQKLLDAIGVSLSGLYAHMPVKAEVRGTGMSVEEVERGWRGAPQQKPLPLVGSAFGGEWSEGVEMTELHLAEVLDYLARPPSLAGDKQAYAVEIVGESMAPRFEPGERAHVSPRAQVRIGDDVIVQLRAAAGEADDAPGETNQLADRVTMVLIKRLVKRAADHLELRQFNPDTTFTVPIEQVAAIHRVVGRL